MSQRPRVMLVFPIFQAMYPKPFHALAEVLVTAGRQTGYEFGVCVCERQSLVTAMNEMGTRVKREGWDAAIVFDDDCFPPFDLVPRLLTRCFDEGHAFVAAAGVMRNYPFTTTAARSYAEGVTATYNKASGKLESLSGFHWLDELPQELTRVDFCGVPAAIIHRRCFDQVTAPWFGDLDELGVRITHDVYFCNKLKAAGIPVYVDGTLRCGHLLDASVCTFENRELLRQTVKPQFAEAGASWN